MKFRTFRVWLSRGHYRLLCTVSGLLLPVVCHGQSEIVESVVMYGVPFSEIAGEDEVKAFPDADGIYIVSEEMPEFPGGVKSLLQYFRDNIRYPAKCKENGIEGRVLVQFIVETDGSISEPVIVKSVNPHLDKEAIRVVSGMPKWIPGYQDKTAVRVKYTVPVNFRISSLAEVMPGDMIRGIVLDADGKPLKVKVTVCERDIVDRAVNVCYADYENGAFNFRGTGDRHSMLTVEAEGYGMVTVPLDRKDFNITLNRAE